MFNLRVIMMFVSKTQKQMDKIDPVLKVILNSLLSLPCSKEQNHRKFFVERKGHETVDNSSL